MPYNISILPDMPIMIASIVGPLNTSHFNDFSKKHAQMRSQVSGMCGHIFDLRSAVLTGTTHVLGASSTLCRIITDHIETDPDFRYVFVTGTKTSENICNSLARHIPIPAFHTVDEAISYLQTKIKGLHRDFDFGVRTKPSLEDTLHDFDDSGEWFHAPDTSYGDYFPTRGVLYLEALDLQQCMVISPERGVIFGRRSGSVLPDVDLGCWSGYSSGVSRHHAQLVLTEDRVLHLYDLNSANGTYVDGNRIPWYQGYPLQHGSEITFGNLRTRLTFSETFDSEPDEIFADAVSHLSYADTH